MRRNSIATALFALLGAALLVIAVVLGVLGSFAFIAIASVGCFFIAAALVSRVSRSPLQRAGAILAILGLALVVFGLVATPLFYLGWACLGAGLVGLAASLTAFRPGARS